MTNAGKPVPVDDTIAATAARDRAKAAFDRADEAWREAIRRDKARGAKVGRLARAAGVHRQRIYQILEHRR
jgi:DNA-binding phage protein